MVNVAATLPNAEAGWVAILPDEFVTAGVGVRTDSDFRRVAEARLVDKVQSVAFGGQHRFRVQKNEGCGPLRMALARVGDRWEVAFGAADGKLDIQIDTDSTALNADIETLKQEASAAKQQNRLGVAISKYQQLEGFYPSGSPEASKFLQSLAAHPEPRVRLQAIRVLAECSALKAPQKLFVAALADADLQVRHAALVWFFAAEGPPPDAVLTGPARSADTYLRQASAFLLARRLKVDTVILAGINTTSCVFCAAFEATNRDYRVITASDACDTMDGPEAHEFALPS